MPDEPHDRSGSSGQAFLKVRYAVAIGVRVGAVVHAVADPIVIDKAHVQGVPFRSIGAVAPHLNVVSAAYNSMFDAEVETGARMFVARQGRAA